MTRENRLENQVTVDGRDEYGTLAARLNSYRRWPTWAGQPIQTLAEEGFYYTGIRDEVKCFTCDVLIRLWSPEDNVRERHQHYSPQCPFLRILDGHTTESRSPEPVVSLSTSPSRQQAQSATSPSLMHMEIRRLETFHSFPQTCPVRPNDLARAGFYATGKGDGAQCFSCGLSLRGWEVGDTAEGEHRRHNPYCTFLSGKDTRNVLLGLESMQLNQATQATTTQRSPTLQYEHSRLSTFAHWPSTVVSPGDLAEAGFYYLRERDAVRCFHCDVRIEQWLPGDVPIEEHIRRSRDCTFAKAVAQRKHRYDTYTTPNAEATANSMKSYEQRQKSFRNWPSTAHVSADSLALAGFYYTGSRDGVRCFSCGGCLKGWQQGDSAWEEHAKFFPSCTHVRQHGPSVTQSHDQPWTQPAQQTQSTTLPLDSESNDMTDFVQQATIMGFSRELAHRVISQPNNRNLSFTTYVEALLEAQSEAEKASLPAASQLMSPASSVATTQTAATLSGVSTVLQPTAPPDVNESSDISQQVQDSHLCKICMEREVMILFMPCAHILCCEACAASIQYCPICRTAIEKKIRSYFA